MTLNLLKEARDLPNIINFIRSSLDSMMSISIRSREGTVRKCDSTSTKSWRKLWMTHTNLYHSTQKHKILMGMNRPSKQKYRISWKISRDKKLSSMNPIFSWRLLASWNNWQKIKVIVASSWMEISMEVRHQEQD